MDGLFLQLHRRSYVMENSIVHAVRDGRTISHWQSHHCRVAEVSALLLSSLTLILIVKDGY